MKTEKTAFFDFVQSADFPKKGRKLRFGKGFVKIKQKKNDCSHFVRQKKGGFQGARADFFAKNGTKIRISHIAR